MTQLAVPRISEPFRVSTARMQGFAGVFAGGAEYNPVFAHVPAMQSMVERRRGGESDVREPEGTARRKPGMAQP